MRISTGGAFRDGVRAMQALQESVRQTRRQVASGKRILRPSDDPIGAARSINFREVISRLEQYQRNGDAARGRLQHEEAALVSVGETLQRVRELALRAGNATESNETRKIFALEMREHILGLVQAANQQDGNSRFLFGGNQDGAQPVSVTAGNFLYNGDQGQRLIQIGATRQIADGDSGSSVFFDIRNGNGTFRATAAAANTGTGVLGPGNVVDPALYDQDQYTIRFIDPDNYQVLDSAAGVVAVGVYQSGESISFRGISIAIKGAPATGDDFVLDPSTSQSMFQTVQNLVDMLDVGANNSVDVAAINNVLNNGLQEIDQALDNISTVRTAIGVRLNAVDSQANNDSTNTILAQEAAVALEGLDYADALSTLSLQAAILEASQQSFVLVQRLSLFQFL